MVSILAISIGAILLTSLTFGFTLMGARMHYIRRSADERIMSAALALESTLPRGYHDGITGSNSVSGAQFDSLVERNNQYCLANNVQYVWSVLVLSPQQIVFTAVTSPDHQMTNHLHAGFFERHKDPGAFAPALQGMQPTYSSFLNQWGEGRMVLIPRRDSLGRVYMLGASVALTELDGLLNRTIAECLGIAALVALLVGLVLTLVLRSILAPIEMLTVAVRRMSTGDLETPLVGAGSRETKELAQAFESLRYTIRQKVEDTQRSAAHIRHLNEVLRAIERVDQLILQKKDAPELLQAVCTTLVQTRGYVVVWAGRSDTASKRVLMVAHAGTGEDVAKMPPITFDESPTGRGPSGTAIRERRTVVINDIHNDPNFALWLGATAASGAFSIASVPLQTDDFCYGVITVKADRLNAFDAEEIELLNNMASNLAHALKAISDETALRESKAVLAEREQQYQTMLATAMDAFWVIDLQGHILDCNAACCTMLGCTRDELLKLSIPDLTNLETQDKFRDRIQRIVEHGSERFESFHQRKDGTVFAVEVSAHHVPLLGGRIFTFIRDITERKRAEAVQQRYQLILQHARDTFLLVKLDGRIMEANAAAEMFYGRTRAELLAMNIMDLRRQDPPELVKEQMRLARKEGILFETHHRRKDGRLVPVEVSSRGVRIGDEEVLLSVIRDITVRKVVESNLRAKEQRLRAISELNDEVIWEVDTQGLYTYVSEACESVMGYRPDEVIGKLHYYDLFPPEQRESMRAQAEAVMAQQQKFVAFPNQVLTKDGRLRDVLTSGIPMFDAAGRYAGYTGSDRDITARKAIETELRTSENRLTQIAEVTDELIWEMDPQGLITYINNVGQKMLGYAPEEVIGRKYFFDMIADHLREQVMPAVFAKVAKREKIDALPCPSKCKDGTLIDLIVTGVPRFDTHGNFLGYRGSNRNVTAQKKADRSIHEMAERLSLATRTAQLGIWDLDVPADTLLWNDEMYELYDCDRDQFKNNYDAWLACVHPEDRERSLQISQRALRGESPYETEFRIITPAGKLKYIHATGRVERNEAGQPVRMIGINMDVTTDKQAAEALQQSKESYRQLVEEISDAIYEVNAAGRITYASPVFETLFGFAPTELLGQEFLRFVAPEDLAMMQAALQDSLHKQTYRYEFRIYAKDGSLRWIRSSGRSILKGGQILGVRGTIADITENKLAQAALWASEERFRTIVEKTSDCFILINLDGIITYVSPPIVKMSGRQPAELQGHHLLENAHSESRREATVALGKLVSKPHETVGLSVRVKHVDGSWRTLECRATNLMTNEAIKGLLVVCQDVTDRERLERQFRQAQKMEAIGTLAGGVAHDFNNMLFAIIGFTTLALRRTQEDPVTSGHLEQVLKASRRSTELVRLLLIFSRQGEKASVEVAVTAILKETFKLLRSTVPTTVDMRLSLKATHDVIKADPIQIQQIIMNLGTNAFHAMSKQGGTMIFQLLELPQAPQRKDLEAPHGWLQLSVSDTGCGIAPAHLDRIFEPFFSTKAVGEGTGLGLAVVHGIVTAARGFIEVESELNRGTTFKVYLPLLNTAVVASNNEAKLNYAAGSSERVLCVDDEQIITSMLQRTLLALGYRVTSFNDSTAALEEFRLHPQDYDLLLSDHGMPQLAGLDLIKAVRAIRPDLPCVLLTGYDSEMVSATECRELNIFLRHKPLTSDELGNALHVALRSLTVE